MTTAGILGSGDVGKTPTLGFKGHGHTVTIGSRAGTNLVDGSAEHGVPEAPFAAGARVIKPLCQWAHASALLGA